MKNCLKRLIKSVYSRYFSVYSRYFSVYSRYFSVYSRYLFPSNEFIIKQICSNNIIINNIIEGVQLLTL